MYRFLRCNNQKGFALLLVLIFIQIFSLLGFYALESSVLAEKTNNESWKNENIYFISEHILHGIEMNFQDALSDCLVKEGDIINDWRSPDVCSGQFEGGHYYYVVEKLGEDSCARIQNTDINQFSAYYFRITLLVMIEKENIKRIFQSTIVKPDRRVEHCDMSFYWVSRGRQAWREISS